MTLIHKITYTFLLLSLSFSTLSSCQLIKKSKDFPNSDMYDFANPKVLDLPGELDEISGIAYYAADTSVFAEIDEAGTLFKIPLKNPQDFKKWTFDKKRDFEDMVLIDSTFYILVSNGDVVTINFVGDSLQTFKSDFSDAKKNKMEFETLYLSQDKSKLIMICKSCEVDKKKTLSSFSYVYNKDSVGAYTFDSIMDVSPVLDKMKDAKHLKPSGGAINPVTGDLYLLSAIQHLIMIFDENGKFKKMYDLDPAIYKQPEGICFTPEGDLIISNEFAETGLANLLLMKNKLKK